MQFRIIIIIFETFFLLVFEFAEENVYLTHVSLIDIVSQVAKGA